MQTTKTPETYLGTARGHPGGNSLDQWHTTGSWIQTGEYIESASENAHLILNFRAKKVYLVVSGTSGTLESNIYAFSDGERSDLLMTETLQVT